MSRSSKAVRLTTGTLFVLAGAFKLLAPAMPGFAGGARGFGDALQSLNVPFAPFFGWTVPLLEVAGGACLLLIPNPKARVVCCALLAADMIVALILVGVPGLFGRALHAGSTTIGTEPWRVPLEIGLLLSVLFVARMKDEKASD